MSCSATCSLEGAPLDLVFRIVRAMSSPFPPLELLRARVAASATPANSANRWREVEGAKPEAVLVGQAADTMVSVASENDSIVLKSTSPGSRCVGTWRSVLGNPNALVSEAWGGTPTHCRTSAWRTASDDGCKAAAERASSSRRSTSKESEGGGPVAPAQSGERARRLRRQGLDAAGAKGWHIAEEAEHSSASAQAAQAGGEDEGGSGSKKGKEAKERAERREARKQKESQP